MTFALVVVPIALLLLGFPIFMVLLTAVTVAVVFFMNVPLAIVHQNLFGSVNTTPLLAVPFFIYAGELMGRGSVASGWSILCTPASAPFAAALASLPLALLRSSARSRARAPRRWQRSARSWYPRCGVPPIPRLSRPD